MEVYTHTSQDYEGDGNAPLISYTSFTDTTGSIRTFQYGDPAKSKDDYEYIIVYKNATRLYDFTVNYRTKKVSIQDALTATDILHVYAYTITGEKIVGEYTEIGDGSSVNFVLANSPSETKQTLVYVDGVETSATVGPRWQNTYNI